MFLNNRFNILVVDDEPDVLALTKMLLRDVEVYGLPVHIEAARSKAEAIEALERYNSPGSTNEMFSVALIDVVMESDHAGLELCDYMRNVQNNYITQLFIRTGQPGTAPEREVIDRYDINGYFTKTEMDETKLYSIIKSGIRQANTLSTAIGAFSGAEAVVVHGGSRQATEAVMRAIADAIASSGKDTEDGEALTRVDSSMKLDGYLMARSSDEEAEALRARLEQLEHHPLNESGDYYTVDESGYLVYVAPSATTSECYGFSWTTIAPTHAFLVLIHKFYRIVAAVWKQGANGHAAS